MKDFNIAKYLKEHNLGSHSILGRYVDLNPLKEEEFNHGQQESDEVPYVGADPKLDGFGDTFDQESPVEEMDNSITGDKGWQYDDEEVTAWEEKLRYYESEVNDLIHDMIDTTQASSDQVADFFQYISTQVRNQGNF